MCLLCLGIWGRHPLSLYLIPLCLKLQNKSFRDKLKVLKGLQWVYRDTAIALSGILQLGAMKISTRPLPLHCLWTSQPFRTSKPLSRTCTYLNGSSKPRPLQAKCSTHVCLQIFPATESKAFFNFSQKSVTSIRLRPNVLFFFFSPNVLICLWQRIVLIVILFCCAFVSKRKTMPW